MAKLVTIVALGGGIVGGHLLGLVGPGEEVDGSGEVGDTFR